MAKKRAGQRGDRALAHLVLALLLLTSSVGATAPVRGYQGPIFDDPAFSAIELTPKWRAPLDSPSAVLLGEALFYLSAGSLVAAEVTSGEELWRYGSSLAGPLATTAGLVLVGGQDLTALHADSGNVAWRYRHEGMSVRTIKAFAEAGAASIVISGHYGEGGAVLNLDGSLRFRVDVPGIGGPTLVEDGILHWQASYGEPHFENVLAFDLNSRKRLWQVGRASGPLAVRDGIAFLLDSDWSQQAGRTPATQELLLVNARSGTEVGRWRYGGTGLADYVPADTQRMHFFDDHVYIVRRGGGAVAELPLGGAHEPSRIFAPMYGPGTYRLGPLSDRLWAAAANARQGLLLFETSIHEVRGVTVPRAGGTPQDAAATPRRSGTDNTYTGPGAPISRLDVHGGTLYVGRTDGTLTAVDLGSAHRRYFVTAGGFGFGPVLAAAGGMILQTTDEVMLVRAETAGHPGPSDEGAVTLVTQRGTVTANADLVAVRNGNGPWRSLTGHEGLYSFPAAGTSYSLAIVCFEGSAPTVTLYQFPPSELPRLRHACVGADDLLGGTFELSGEVSGLEFPPSRPWHLFDVAFGRSALVGALLPADAPFYSLWARAGTGDLLALRTPMGEPPDRAILRRALRVDGPTRVDLDLNAASAVELEQYSIHLPAGVPAAMVRARFRTCNGTAVEMVQVPLREPPQHTEDASGSGLSLRYSAPPGKALLACDRFQLSALTTGTDGEFRFHAMFIAQPQDVALTLPELPPPPLMAFSGDSHSGLQVRWSSEPEADIYLFLATRAEVTWQVFRSARLEPALELPELADLSGQWTRPPAGSVNAPSDLYFGVIESSADPEETLFAFENALGYGYLTGLPPGSLQFSVALRPVEAAPAGRGER